MNAQRFRILAIIAALMVSGFLLTTLTSYYAARTSLSDQISQTTLPLTSNNIYSEIQRDLLQPIFISSLMAQDTFVRDWKLAGEQNPEQMIRYLREIQTRYRTVTSFFISDATKKYYHSTGILKTVSEDDPGDDWYFRFRASGQEYEINMDFDTAAPDFLTVFINYRVYDFTGNFIGVTGVGLSVDKVHALIASYQQRFGRKVTFVDRNGIVMLSTATDDIGQSIRDSKELGDVATQILANPSSTFSYQRDGKTVHLNSRLIEEFQWYLLVEQREDTVEQGITDTLISNLIISFIVCSVIIGLAYVTISRYQARVENLATTDKLTNIPNRHVFDTIYDQTAKLAKRHDTPVTYAMLDIDHFKQVNDTYGHNAGDQVIKTVVAIIKERLRVSDTVCRWGGEEFLLIFPECPQEEAQTLCDEIRRNIEKRTIICGTHDIAVTVSIGLSAMKCEEPPHLLIKRVDEALYKAKHEGRNLVKLAS